MVSLKSPRKWKKEKGKEDSLSMKIRKILHKTNLLRKLFWSTEKLLLRLKMFKNGRIGRRKIKRMSNHDNTFLKVTFLWAEQLESQLNMLKVTMKYVKTYLFLNTTESQWPWRVQAKLEEEHRAMCSSMRLQSVGSTPLLLKIAINIFFRTLIPNLEHILKSGRIRDLLRRAISWPFMTTIYKYSR